jgi:alkylation response protein AidB-like acyl-CoA dehydrogenase
MEMVMIGKANFAEGDEILKLARQIVGKRIAPNALDRDKNRTFPWDGIRALGEAGILGLVMSEDRGGFGGGRVGFAFAAKEIARACASTALVYVSHLIVAKAIELSGGEAVKNTWLPEMLKGQSLGAFAVHEPDCGSNAGAITTQARKDGDHYIVNGSKFFITSAGEAKLYLVLVRTDTERGPQGMTRDILQRLPGSCQKPHRG